MKNTVAVEYAIAQQHLQNIGGGVSNLMSRQTEETQM